MTHMAGALGSVLPCRAWPAGVRRALPPRSTQTTTSPSATAPSRQPVAWRRTWALRSRRALDLGRSVGPDGARQNDPCDHATVRTGLQSGRRRRARESGQALGSSWRPAIDQSERGPACMRLVVRWSLSLTELGTGGRETDKAS